MYKCMTKDIPLSSFASDIFLPLAWVVMLNVTAVIMRRQAKPLLLPEVTQFSTGSTVWTRTDGQGQSTHLMLLRQY